MSTAFSVASWNVQHFGGGRAPDRDPDTVVSFLTEQDPDVMGVSEVNSAEVFRPIIDAFPNHAFHITEGPQVQEILVGFRQDMLAFVTQKIEFKSGQSMLRPGTLLTVQAGGASYPLLFLHLKSSDEPKGFGLRDNMIERARKFRKVLNEAGDGKANYIFLGDLNTMGLNYTYPHKKHDIPAEEEISHLESITNFNDMRVLSKSAQNTWRKPGHDDSPSNLDHVVAADHLEFNQFGGAEVDVRGWPKLEDEGERNDWYRKYSDHALLYFEVQEV